MAHPLRPSLMSRLFPQDRPSGQFSSSEDLSSSTLLAHMSTPGFFSTSKAPFLSSSSREEQHHPHDILFRACLANISNNSARHRVQEDKPAGGDALTQLREAFAQDGVKLYTSAVDKLAEAQQVIASQISDFVTLSTSVASEIDELYANLSYPLSTTLCHSNNFPRATIEGHLANVKAELREAESELRDLECEWQESIRSEENLRRELRSMEKSHGQNGELGHHDEDYAKMAGFKQEAERIVAESTQELDEIDQEYKKEVMAMTMKTMRAMGVQ
ncbi:hypothetical protein V8C42DRAFT_341291 [Trichoderma barbatum]